MKGEFKAELRRSPRGGMVGRRRKVLQKERGNEGLRKGRKEEGSEKSMKENKKKVQRKG